MIDDTSLSLLARLSKNPAEADWHRLVEIYTPLMRKWLQFYGVSDPDISDLTQDVFQTLVREFPSFEHNGNTGAFRRWLRMMIVNRLKWLWRSRAKEAMLWNVPIEDVIAKLEDPNSDPNRIWDAEHDATVAQSLLKMVEPQFTISSWKAFRMQAIEGKSAGSVAESLGMSVNAVLIAKSRVLKALRDEAKGMIDID